MNKEDMIRMAREAGMDYLQYISPEAFEKVVVFAALVAEHEREECAKVCEWYEDFAKGDLNHHATLIRKRGQA